MTIRENGYFYTGVKASEEEEGQMRAAYSVPYMIIGEYAPMSPAEVIHAVAVGKKGLPDIVGFYGYDFKEHEFIRMPDADQGEPDKWPSRKLEDILKAAGI